MDIKNWFLTTFLVSLLLLAGLFIGNIIGQLSRGEIDYLNDIEISIIIAAIILCIQLTIVGLSLRKKKITKTEEYVKEARKITY